MHEKDRAGARDTMCVGAGRTGDENGWNPIRVVIVDFDSSARTYLESLLSIDSNVDVIATCASVAEASPVLAALKPDAMFLGVEMPIANGLDLAREAEAARCLVVFVTQHDQYAVDAFDVGAVDYLMKPVDPARCRKALAKLADVLATRNGARGSASIDRCGYLRRLFVRSGEHLIHVPVDAIDVAEALGKYVKLRVADASYLLRTGISALENRLDPCLFVRTHRSFIVNISRIRQLVPVSHGDYKIALESGRSVPLSRFYRGRLLTLEFSTGADSV